MLSELLPVALGLVDPGHVEPLHLGLEVVVLQQHAVEEVGELTVHHHQVQARALAIALSQELHAELLDPRM